MTDPDTALKIAEEMSYVVGPAHEPCLRDWATRLFSDLQHIVLKANDDLVSLIKSRISEYENAERARVEREREKIRAEEEARAQREAEKNAEAERQRIRVEERAKAQAEAAKAIPPPGLTGEPQGSPARNYTPEAIKPASAAAGAARVVTPGAGAAPTPARPTGAIYTKEDAEALCAIAVAAAQPDAAKYRALTTPEIHNFIVAVEREALHQRDRWAAEHDAGKTDADWFWLVGYLAGKAINKPDKILHHIITTAAACLNWHAAKLGTHTAMRPGIEEPK